MNLIQFNVNQLNSTLFNSIQFNSLSVPPSFLFFNFSFSFFLLLLLGAPQNHWFGPAGDPRAAGIGTPEAIKMVKEFNYFYSYSFLLLFLTVGSFFIHISLSVSHFLFFHSVTPTLFLISLS